MNEQMNGIVGTLIAGPARCGKSTLAASLVGKIDSSAILTVDALFPAFHSSKALRSLDDRIRFVGDYLRRPRFTDPNRETVRCPADDMGDSFEAVVAETVKEDTLDPVRLIGAALDTWAEKIGEKAWIAPDLHAEIYFESLMRVLPNLRMIVLLRDPRETVAASLYWRTYPDRLAGGWRMMLHKLLLWCLSADVGYRLSQAMPGRVGVVFANLPSQAVPEIFSEPLPGFVIPSKLISGDTLQYFSYTKGRGWLGPDECWQPLLSDQERCVIEQVCRRWFSFPDRSGNCESGSHVFSLGVSAFLAIILGIARFNPGMAKSLMEFVLFPISNSRKLMYDFARAFFRKHRWA